LAAGRADHLDADEGKALAEFVDDLLLHFDERRRVEDDPAFLARRLDEAVGGRKRLCRTRTSDDCEAAERGGRPQRMASGQSGTDHPAFPHPWIHSKAFLVVEERRVRLSHTRRFATPPPKRGRLGITADSRRSCSTPRAIRRAV